MTTLFGILLVVNGLLIAFLTYHFAVQEHALIPATIHTQSAYAESLKAYRGRADELELSAALARQKPARAGTLYIALSLDTVPEPEVNHR